jgi:hypothetical protein
MKSIVRYTSVALFAGCVGITAFAAEHDIAGLKLGMSPEQAKAALKAFGIDPSRIRESKASYQYTDGVNAHSTAEFLDRIGADKIERKNGQRVVDNFDLRFAPPPKGGQLVMVRRRTDNPVDPPTVGDYRAAILDKHGKPDIDKSGSLMWLEPRNAVNCTGSAPQAVAGILASIYMGSDQTGWRLNELRNAKKVREPSQCARMLEYRMPSSPNQPATSVTAVLVDVPGWGTAYLATLGWIDEQRQAAVKAREGAASKPRL